MEIVPLSEGEKIGAEARRNGKRVAHLVGVLGEAFELDWRATNLLASRFWPKRGFAPTHLRLRRDVQLTA